MLGLHFTLAAGDCYMVRLDSDMNYISRFQVQLDNDECGRLMAAHLRPHPVDIATYDDRVFVLTEATIYVFSLHGSALERFKWRPSMLTQPGKFFRNYPRCLSFCRNAAGETCLVVGTGGDSPTIHVLTVAGAHICDLRVTPDVSAICAGHSSGAYMATSAPYQCAVTGPHGSIVDPPIRLPCQLVNGICKLHL